jgi:predicted transcriptional regulator
MPGVSTPSFPFGGVMLTGLRIRNPPFRRSSSSGTTRAKKRFACYKIRNDGPSGRDLQGAFSVQYCVTMFYNISMRKAKTVCITLPPDLLAKAQKIAVREHRTMSELFREALRRYMALSSGEKGERGKSLGVEARRSGECASEEHGTNVLHSFRMEKPLQE